MAQEPSRFVAMTGYLPDRFADLLPYFRQAHDEYLSKYHMNGKRRKALRRFVLYANSPLPCHEERLAFILSYLKLNPLQEQHADTFSMQQKQCNEFLHGLKLILDKALELACVLPSQTNEDLQHQLVARRTPAETGPEQPLLNLLHDGVERAIPRPVDQQAQRENYSGKKKKHTVKNALITTMLCLILFVSQTVAGSVHDKKIADQHYSIPKGFNLWQDSGYQGFKPEGVDVRQPRKKPKGAELSKEQKELNRFISSFRVRIEHAICSVKRYRVVKEPCRLRKNRFVDQVFRSCAALHNFRILNQPFNYPIKMT